MNSEFHIYNRKKLLEQLDDNSFVVQFSGRSIRRTADDAYTFFANRNFVYITGIDYENIQYIATKNNGCIKECLFIESSTEKEEIWTGRKMRIEEAQKISGIEDVYYNNEFKLYLHKLIQSGCYKKIYLDLDMFVPDMAKTYEQSFANILQTEYPHMTISNIHPFLRIMRTYKRPEEIEKIRNAITLTKKGIDAMMSTCRPGMKEYELEAEFKYILAKAGCREPAFKPIVASGENIFYLHYDKPYGNVRDGDLVLCDVGASVDGYCADISRVFPANGKFTDKQKAIYEAAYAGITAAQEVGRPGCTFERFNETAQAAVYEHLKPLGLVEKLEDIKKYMIHKVSHHIGLDVHDVGIYDIPFAENMVITLDVGIYVKEWNIGLRIEDDILITKIGIENLADTAGIIKSIDELESAMKSI